MGLLDRFRSAPQPKDEAAPLSVSGRGHVDGFLALEELNPELQGRQGLQVYDQMYRTDGDVRQIMGLICNPIIAGTWEVEPAGGSEATPEAIADAALVEWALFSNMQPTLKGHLLEALPVLFRSGFAPFEKVWQRASFNGTDVLVPRTLGLRLPRTIYRWAQDEFGQLSAIEQVLPVPKQTVIAGPNIQAPGIAMPGELAGPPITSVLPPGPATNAAWIAAENLVYYRVGAEGDNWEGVSMLRPVYKHWKLKDVIERLDAVAQEREALGTPICYPPLGATPDQFDAMERVLAGLRTNEQGYVIMPGPKAGTGAAENQGWLVEILGPDRAAGSGRDPMPSLKYHTDKIAAAFIAEFVRLGHNLTGGARATAQVQADPFLVSVEAIAGLIEDVINEQLVAPIIAYNRPNATEPPRLKMSLVDATSLTQLADFVMKLTQVGALLPDQQLEDFLRSRADLPAADSSAVKDRGEEDQQIRREVVMGAKNNVGEAQQPGGAAGNAPAKGKGDPNGGGPSNPGGGGGSKGKSLDSLPGRPRWRDLRPAEMRVDLDGIESYLDSLGDVMCERGMGHVVPLAQRMAESYPAVPNDTDSLQNLILDHCSAAYEYGQQTVRQEMGDAATTLDSGARDRGRLALGSRAALAHDQVVHAMHHAIGHADLNHGTDLAARQGAAERAGRAALRKAGRVHGVPSFTQGRTDAIQLAAEDAPDEWGVLYTAILDDNTCSPCRAADDGVVRSLDDPVRLEHRPPNPACDSLASGENQCRCFEIPEPLDASQ